ncbi:MAG: LemA family protein [Burkholderiaceae bacterium]|jgi:LemA protein|nr:LemA family protein [Burkholderiaceae bacterium]
MALAAMLGVFWFIGARRRLRRLRAAVAQCYLTLDEALMRYALWMQGCLPSGIRMDFFTQPAPLELPAHEPGAAWVRLQGALTQYMEALACARRAPLMGGDVTAVLVLAHGALAAAWHGAMRERGAQQQPPTEQLQLRHGRLLSQCVPPREAYNEAVKTYNAAIAQFPALLLARLFKFRPAGNLLRLTLEP